MSSATLAARIQALLAAQPNPNPNGLTDQLFQLEAADPDFAVSPPTHPLYLERLALHH